MSIVGIAMTVPTIVFLLVGGVASDRLDRRRIMLAADVARAAAVGVLARAVAHRRARAVARRRAGRRLRHGRGVLRPGLRRDRPGADPGRAPRAGQRARADRAPAGHAARRAGDRRRRWSARVGAGTAFALDAASFLVSAAAAAGHAPPARAAACRRRRMSVVADLREGWRFVRAPHVAVGDVRQRGDRLPAASWARSRCCCRYIVKEDLRRQRDRPRHRVRRRRPRLGRLRGAARPTRAAAARHHVHVRRLDAGHAGRRRLRRWRAPCGS